MRSLRSLFTTLLRFTLVTVSIVLLIGTYTPAASGQTAYVIVISVDGGGASYIQNLIDLDLLPNFERFQTEGAWTNNARNDHDYMITLPNHVAMVTSRAVLGDGESGHLWTGNVDPSDTPSAANYSIQNNKGMYVPGVFDVAHDNGLRTALYATKTKFSLFDHSYNNGNGAHDTTGPDNGLNKIDTYVYNSNSLSLTTSFTTAMEANPFNYVLVHYADSDTYGHASGWGSTPYNNALIAVDGYIGSIFDLITSNSVLQGKTAIILTADHGGNGTNHGDNNDPLNYTIPFYVWGPDVEAGADLYDLNSTLRLNPHTGLPAYTDSVQPIRNSESANLSLKMLDLNAIPGSTFNEAQDLSINSNPPVPDICVAPIVRTCQDRQPLTSVIRARRHR